MVLCLRCLKAIKMSRRRYSEEHLRFVEKNLPGRSYREVYKTFEEKFKLGVSYNAFCLFCKNNGVKNGLDGRFVKGEKGRVPWNKGMKGLQVGGKETQFKKGEESVNRRPVGSERLMQRDGYTYVKVAQPDKWRLKHHIIFEEAHGEIPSGYKVAWGDGDRTNFSADNLVLVSDRQMIVMNKMGLKSTSAEITKTGTIIAELKLKIAEKKRGD